MKKKMYRLVFAIIAVLSVSISAQTKSDIVKLKALDSRLPGNNAEMFAEGILSSPILDWGITIPSKMDEIFFTCSIKGKNAIAYIRWENGKWTDPEIAPFSGKYPEFNPVINKKGNKIIFLSKRPINPGDSAKITTYWCVEKKNNKWGEPQIIEELRGQLPFYSFTCMDENENLYMTSSLDKGKKIMHTFTSRLVNGKYTKPEQLKGEINTEWGEYCPFISPDGKYIIIEIVDAPGGLGGGDMYISKKGKDGSWGKPVNLGSSFNSNEHDCLPIMTPGGDYLIFMSCRKPEFYKNDGTLSYKQMLWQQATYNDEPFDFYWINSAALYEFLK